VDLGQLCCRLCSCFAMVYFAAKHHQQLLLVACRQVQRDIRRAVNSPNSAASKAATRQRGKARADSALRKGVSYSNLDEGVW
jgi:hypothetical protein